jgi:hypothetical protein
VSGAAAMLPHFAGAIAVVLAMVAF